MYIIPMPVATELDIEPQATPEERRMALIEKARTRLLQNPDTFVSHQVKDPERIRLELFFRPYVDADVRVDIFSWPDSLYIHRETRYIDSIGRAHTLTKMIDISAEQQTYLDWLGAGWLEGDKALTQTENDIEDFLPAEQPFPQVA